MNTSPRNADLLGDCQTHVCRLIRKHAPGKSIREIERAAGLSNDSLARFARPDWDKRQLHLSVIHRFMNALGASIDDVTEAFARDMDLPLKGRPLTTTEDELLDCFAALTPELQDALLAMAQVLREKVPANQPTPATS